MTKRNRIFLLASLLLPLAHADIQEKYYVNANDIGGATVLPSYLTTGTGEWDTPTLTTIDWRTWDNPWAASTLSTAVTTPTSPTTTDVTSSATTSASSSSSTHSTASSTSSSTSTSASSSSSSTNLDTQEKSKDKNARRAKIVIGVVCGIVGLVGLLAALLVLLCFIQKRRNRRESDEKDINIREIPGMPDSNEKGLGPAGIAAAGAAGVAALGAVEVLGDDDDDKKGIERIDSPMDDNASTITGSFASLSEKLKEIQQQYSGDEGDNDNLSTFSTINGDHHQSQVITDAAIAKTRDRSSYQSDSSVSTGETHRSSYSSYRSSLKEASPSINNKSLKSVSPKNALAVIQDSASESRESDDDLYVDRKVDSSDNSSNEAKKNNLSPFKPRKSNESPNTVTTGTSVITGVDSDAASFEHDENYPNKYNNFATELLAAKPGKPKLVQIDSKDAESNKVLETVKEEDNRKESITTINGQHSQNSEGTDYESTTSKKRDSQFDFESGDDEDLEDSKEKNTTEASFFKEKI